MTETVKTCPACETRWANRETCPSCGSELEGATYHRREERWDGPWDDDEAPASWNEGPAAAATAGPMEWAA